MAIMTAHRSAGARPGGLVDQHDRAEGEPEAGGVGLGPLAGVEGGQAAGLEVGRVVLLDDPLRPTDTSRDGVDGRRSNSVPTISGSCVVTWSRLAARWPSNTRSSFRHSYAGWTVTPVGRPVARRRRPRSRSTCLERGRARSATSLQRLGRRRGGVADVEHQHGPIGAGVGPSRSPAPPPWPSAHPSSRSSPRSRAGRRLRDRAGRDEVGAGRGVGGDRVEVDPARHLHQRPAGHERDA